MKQTAKTALGGIVAALSLTVLLAFSFLPFLEYALPAFAGALIMLIVIEINKAWAFGVYLSVSLLALILMPNKEAAMMYAALFGYYPILKSVFESKLPRILEYVCKILLFLVTISAAYFVMIRFMGITFEDLDSFGKFSVPILLCAGTVVFIVYDYTLSMFVRTYLRVWQKKFRKIFKK